MLVLVDESGDTGMSGMAGQSDFFVVTLVRFESNREAERADAGGRMPRDRPLSA